MDFFLCLVASTAMESVNPDVADNLSEGSAQNFEVMPIPTSGTVLIVDDNQDNLELASFIAEQQGIQVLLASSAQEVFPQLNQPIDLILLDIVLPDIDGFTLLKQLRQSNLLSASVPVVAVTALASEREKRRIEAAGFSGYLAKPYTIEALEQILQQPYRIS